jgi:hypothetical protein
MAGTNGEHASCRPILPLFSVLCALLVCICYATQNVGLIISATLQLIPNFNNQLSRKKCSILGRNLGWKPIQKEVIYYRVVQSHAFPKFRNYGDTISIVE